MSDLRTLSIKNSQGENDKDEMANVYKQLKIRIDEAKASTEALFKAVDQDEDAKAAVGKLIEDINKFESKLEAAKDDAEQLGDILTKLNDPDSIGEKIQQTAFNIGSDNGLIAETANQDINQGAFDLKGQFEAAANAEAEAIKFRNASADAGDTQDGLNKKFEKAKISMNDWATSISNATSLIMGVGAAIASIQGAIDTFNNPDASAWDKVSAVFGVIISLLPLASTLMTTFGTTTAAAGATAGAGITAALGPIGWIIGAITAAIVGLTLAFSALQKAYNKDAINAKKAAENAEQLAQGAEKAKNALEGLKAGFDAYDTAVDKLSKCVRGTDEWNAALAEVNDTVLDLLDTYPELLGQKNLFVRNEDGMLEIDPNKQKEIIEQAEKAAEAAQAAELVGKARAAEAQAISQNTQVSRNIGSFYSSDSQGYTDATVNAGQIMTANKELLSGLTPEEFEKELRNLIVKPAGMLDSEYEAMISKLLGYQSSIDSLVTATENAATQMDNATLILANNVLGDEFGATEKAAAAQAYEEAQEQIYNDIIALDAEKNSKDMKTSTTAEAIWDRFQAATGITYELSDNAIRGTDDERTYAYRDEQGKDQTYTIEYIAQTIAASEALTVMTGSAQEAQEMLNQLGEKGTAFAAALGSGTDKSSMANFLSGLTQDELDAFQAGITTDENGNTVLDQAALDAIGLTAEQFEKLATTFGISVTDLTNNLVSASKDVEQSGFDYNTNKRYSDYGLNTGSMSVGEQQEFLNNRNAFSKNFIDAGTWSGFDSIIKQNASLGGEVLSDFMQEMSLLNPLAEDSEAQIQALVDKYGIQGEAIQALIGRTNELDKQYNISAKNIEQNAQTIKDVVGEGLEIGDIISQEDLSKLQQAGVDTSAFFSLMEDGTYSLTGSAEEFNNIVNRITFDGLKDQVLDFNNSYNQLDTDFSKTDLFDTDTNLDNTDLGKTRLDYIDNFEAGSFDFSGIEGADELLSSFKDNPDLELNPEQLQIVADMMTVVNEKQVELTTQALMTATSLDDLNAKMTELGSVSSYSYGEALVNLASQHSNCSDEINEYQRALDSENQAQIDAALSALELGIAVGESAEKYGLNAEDLEDYAKRLKEVEGNEKLSSEAAVRLATSNMRLDKGVTNLNSNLADYRKALKNNNKGSAEWSKTLTSLKDDLADITGIADGGMLSDKWAEDIADSKLLEKALKGDSDAILELRTLAADDIIQNLEVDDSSLATVNEQWEYLKANMANGVSAEGVDQSALIESFNQMIEAGNMTKDQIEAALSGLNVSANIKTTYNQMETEVPTTITRQVRYIDGYSDIDVNGDGQTQKVANWVTETQTYSGAPKTVMGYVPTYSIEGTTDGEGSSTVAFEKLPTPKVSNSSSNSGKGGSGKTSSKKTTASKERYHKTNKKIDNANRDKDRAAANKDQAFGKEKLKYIDEEIAAIEDLQEAYKGYAEEAEDYLKTDLQAIEKLGLNPEIKDGIIQNWDDIIDKEKAAYEKVMNGTYVDEASKEAAEQRWQDVQDAIKQYEDTVEEMEKIKDEQAELERERISKELEKITTEVDFEIEINQRDLDKLDYAIDKLNRTVGNMVEVIDKMGTKVGAYENQSQAARDGIARIQQNAADEGRELTDDEQRQIWAYEDQLLDINTSLMDLVETVENSVMEEFERMSEEIDKNISRFDTYSEAIDHYSNIIKLSGRQTKDSMLLMELAAQKTDIAMEKLNASRDKYLSQQSAQADAKANLDAAIASGNQKDIDYWQKQYDDITMTVEESHNEMLASWENVLQAASDQFDNAIEITLTTLKESISAYGLDGLADRYEKAKETQDLYLSNLDKEYELNKLNRQIQDSIDGTDNIIAKEKLLELQKEINEKMAEGVEMSQYDLEYMQKKYDLELAKIALEEAQNAKSTVRLQKDSEGNFGYVYTADQDQVDNAQQNYEDKLHDLKSHSQEYLDDMSEKIIQNQQDMMEALAAVDKTKFETQEEYEAELDRIKAHYMGLDKYYRKEMQKAMDELGITYQDTLLGQLEGSADLDEAQKTLQQNTDTATKEMGTAWATWHASVDKSMEEAGTSSENFSKDVKKDMGDIEGATDDLAEDIDNKTEEMTEDIGILMQKVKDWRDDYLLKIQDMIDANEKLALSEGKEPPKTNNPKPENNDDKGGKDPDSDDGTGGKSGGTSKGSYTVKSGDTLSGIASAHGLKTSELYNKNESIIESTAKARGYSSSKNGHWIFPGTILQLKTGGYTGEWGPEGKLAILHEKEMVLNANDTENLLQTISFIRDIISQIDTQANMASLFNMSPTSGISAMNEVLEQTVTIHAEFPNATNHSEIEEAFKSLVNRASQYANRK